MPKANSGVRAASVLKAEVERAKLELKATRDAFENVAVHAQSVMGQYASNE